MILLRSRWLGHSWLSRAQGTASRATVPTRLLAVGDDPLLLRGHGRPSVHRNEAEQLPSSPPCQATQVEGLPGPGPGRPSRLLVPAEPPGCRGTPGSMALSLPGTGSKPLGGCHSLPLAKPAAFMVLCKPSLHSGHLPEQTCQRLGCWPGLQRKRHCQPQVPF